MVSVESATVFPKFNVDAKPFEMYVPTTYMRSPLSSESSDSSTYEFAENRYLDIGDDPNDEPDPIFTPPDEDLRDRIVKQIEFYFSDVNLTKDAFLLKHVKRNKEGNVSLKLISSFKKVKTLTKDWRVVAYSLKSSDKLVVNETGTKVGRRDPLPPYDETTPSRTVIAMNLPLDRPTVENVSELFSKCGEIALTRILRPGAPVPPDIKQFVPKHPGIGTCVCAVIEFTAAEGAQKAVAEMGGKNNDWRSMHVVEMCMKKDSPESEDGKKDEDKKKRKNKKRSPKNEKDDSPTGSRRKELMMAFPVLADASGKQMFKSPSASPELMANGSPWVHRRRLAAKENEMGRRVESCKGGSCNKTMMIPEGVIRLPKGPDGTRGFHGHGGRRASPPISILFEFYYCKKSFVVV
uniref:Uncharacterized protein n=1 Tax=Strigamia maritima TaxID=126957 RepID=T1J2X6_STRMM